MSEVYYFKIAFRHADKREARSWHQIQIEAEKTLWDLDQTLRRGLGYELDDHLSRFTIHGYCFEINPNEKTDPALVKVEDLSLRKGQKIEWLYDFGDWWEHVIVFIGKVDKLTEDIERVTSSG